MPGKLVFHQRFLFCLLKVKLIVTSSVIDKMFEILGPIFEQNVTINFELSNKMQVSVLFPKKVHISNNLSTADEVNISLAVWEVQNQSSHIDRTAL